MHTKILNLSLACAAFCAFPAIAFAQEAMPIPEPAKELKKLEPLVGTWQGGGTINEPGAAPSTWKAVGAFRWSHDGFWLQEDFVVHFETMKEPVTARAYLGWDGENGRYVRCGAMSTGQISMHELEMLPDGQMMVMAVRRDRITYAERTLRKVDGDTMTQNIDMLMPNMSIDFAQGTFQRVDEDPCDALAHGAFGPPVGEEMKTLNRGAGVYDVEGSLIMMPGAPPMKITGSDTWAPRFGGKVLHGTTHGTAEGMPGKYVSDVFWGWDAKRKRFASIYVSNMGEVGAMDMWAAQDGSYISTVAATNMGQPMAQRFVLRADEDGTFTSGVGHTMMGAAEPFQSFSATYRKRK